MALTPLRIEPIFTPRIWGARSLAPLYPDKIHLSEPIGEAWLTGRDCKIASGPFAGKTLGAAWHEMSSEWRGTALMECAEFPSLVKFIFPNEKLSIQVHPDDTYASVYEKNAGGRGKTEMWHVVSAEAGAQVLVGLKRTVNREKFLEALQSHTLENLFEAHPVHAGDTFFVPAGTPHTIGSGMIICEVQQYSDLTYRVYDFGRLDPQGKPRELHIEKALQVTKFGENKERKTAPLPIPASRVKKNLLAACEYFATERWEFSESAELSTLLGAMKDRFSTIIILSGSGEIQSKDEMSGTLQSKTQKYHQGETWLLPAALHGCKFLPSEPTTLIRTYVPDLAVLKQELSQNGLNQAQIASTVFDES